MTSGFGVAIDSLMKLYVPKSTGSVFATELRLFCYIFKVNMIQEKLCKRGYGGDANALSEFWGGSVTVSHFFTYKKIPLD